MADSNWLEHLETLNEIKEEPIEIKEEPFDEMDDIKQEDPNYYPSDNVKDEIEEINDDFGEFADVKQEEPILDAFIAIENESMKIKEDPVDNFIDVKDEELSTLPIADVFCPSTGDCRPLNIDLDADSRMRVIRRQRFNKYSLRKLCTLCDFCYRHRDEIDNHLRLMHPEEWKTQFMKCDSCDGYYHMGAGMATHVQHIHPEKAKKISSVALTVSNRGRKSEDEELVVANGLSISAAEIAEMPVSDFQQLLKGGSLTEAQRQLIKKIRRRGRNKVASRAYRKRRSLSRKDENSADIKQEELIFYPFNTNENGPVEIKEEDPIDDFFDIKEVEMSTLPIADVLCPSTGGSRPLTIDIDNGMHSTSQIASPRQTMMKATKTIIVQGSVKVTRDSVIKLDRSQPCFSLTPLDTVVTSAAPIIPTRSLLVQNGASTISDCTTCTYLDPNSDIMKQHIRLRHPERFVREMRLQKKCSFCEFSFSIGAEMNKHVRTMHPGRQYVKCDFCEGTYSMGAGMAIHFTRMHLEESKKISGFDSNRELKSKDDELAIANGLPISAAEIADMPLFDLNQLFMEYSLTEQQCYLMRQIRRRGQRNVSSRERAANAAQTKPWTKAIATDQ